MAILCSRMHWSSIPGPCGAGGLESCSCGSGGSGSAAEPARLPGKRAARQECASTGDHPVRVLMVCGAGRGHAVLLPGGSGCRTSSAHQRGNRLAASGLCRQGSGSNDNSSSVAGSAVCCALGTAEGLMRALRLAACWLNSMDDGLLMGHVTSLIVVQVELFSDCQHCWRAAPKAMGACNDVHNAVCFGATLTVPMPYKYV